LSIDVLMPRLSDSTEEATVLKWLVAEGDVVEAGQPLVEVETDKATMTYEAEVGGVVLELLAGEGDAAPFGVVIARIGDAGEEATPSRTQPAPAAAGLNSGSSDRPPRPKGAVRSLNRVKATPVARRLAEETGVDLSLLQGTGPGGRIQKADVEAAGAQAAPRMTGADDAPDANKPATDLSMDVDGVKGAIQRVELTKLQRTVVRRMSESKATAPDFELETDIDMSACIELRAQIRTLSAARPTVNDMVVKAAAIALRHYPRVNGAYRDGFWELYSRVNIGVAVAADHGLVVPTLFDADQKSLHEIALAIRELAKRVRARDITAPELAGGTFTVSNLGMFGVDRFSAIINPPQAAILAVGRLGPRPMVDDQRSLVIRDGLTLRLVCDHRVLDGAEAARFVGRIRSLLEDPIQLLIDDRAPDTPSDVARS
jgi:pyruvate dehydrogenase E2 component (dihydrolipoamide acetyltransferase)